MSLAVVDCRAGAAWGWVREAFAIFRRQPAGWLALMACWALVSMVVFIFPLVGAPLCTMLQPALFAGFVIAARDAEAGKTVTPAHLLAGFRANGRSLVMVGSIGLIAEILVMYLLNLLGMPTVPIRSDGMPDLAGLSAALAGKEWILILGLVLVMAIKGLLWFTTPLLAFEAMGPGAAIRWSVYAFVANFAPLVVLCLVLSALFFAASLPLMLGLPLWLPLYALAHYTSFQAVFRRAGG